MPRYSVYGSEPVGEETMSYRGRAIQQHVGAFSCRSFGRAKDLQKGDKILKRKKTRKVTVGLSNRYRIK